MNNKICGVMCVVDCERGMKDEWDDVGRHGKLVLKSERERRENKEQRLSETKDIVDGDRRDQ